MHNTFYISKFEPKTTSLTRNLGDAQVTVVIVVITESKLALAARSSNQNAVFLGHHSNVPQPTTDLPEGRGKLLGDLHARWNACACDALAKPQLCVLVVTPHE